MKDNTEHYRYIDLEKLPNGLRISLNDDGKEEVADMKSDDKGDYDILSELFDDVRGNSEYEFHPDLGSMGFGLTEAPGVTDGYYYDDDGEFTDEGHDDSEVYYYDNYMITSPLDKMVEDGSVTFDRIEKDKMASGGQVGLKVENYNDLDEVAKYMVKAVKKQHDLKDLIYYFEKDNDFDYKVRVKIWDEMNVYEMPKTYDNILKLLKAIVDGNGKELSGDKMASGGGIGELKSPVFYKEGSDKWGLGYTEIFIKEEGNEFIVYDNVFNEDSGKWGIKKIENGFENFDSAKEFALDYARKNKKYTMASGGEVSDISFFDIQFTLGHLVQDGKLKESEMDSILDKIKSNRIKISELKNIEGVTPKILETIINTAKSGEYAADNKMAAGGTIKKEDLSIETDGLFGLAVVGKGFRKVFENSDGSNPSAKVNKFIDNFDEWSKTHQIELGGGYEDENGKIRDKELDGYIDFKYEGKIPEENLAEEKGFNTSMRAKFTSPDGELSYKVAVVLREKLKHITRTTGFYVQRTFKGKSKYAFDSTGLPNVSDKETYRLLKKYAQQKIKNYHISGDENVEYTNADQKHTAGITPVEIFKDGGELSSSSMGGWYARFGALFGGSYFASSFGGEYNFPKMKSGGKVWFKEAIREKKPYTLGGWEHTMSAESRREKAISSRPPRWDNHKKYLSAGRALQALANVSTDESTRDAASSDAKYFFGMAKKHGGKTE